MEIQEFEKILTKNLKELEIELDEKQVTQLYTYMQLLLEWNEKINLTAITDPEEIILKHFVDSLTIAKYIKKEATLVDVGTGAGFPGIPLKIYRKDIKITLMDSLNKRINFLNDVINKLDLQEIETIHSRAEEFGRNKKYREKFDIATSRAVANMSTLSEYLMPCLNENGIAISMKGPKVSEELERAKKAIKLLGGEIMKVEEFCLPNSDIERTIVLIKKKKNTPSKFPRKPGTPAKDPIF